VDDQLVELARLADSEALTGLREALGSEVAKRISAGSAIEEAVAFQAIRMEVWRRLADEPLEAVPLLLALLSHENEGTVRGQLRVAVESAAEEREEELVTAIVGLAISGRLDPEVAADAVTPERAVAFLCRGGDGNRDRRSHGSRSAERRAPP
jgi:hypothetical protein